MVKRFLTMKGKDFKVVNLDDDPTTRQRLFEKTGAMTVPITEKNDQFIIGWNPSRLATL